ncbi:heavy metal translocating P-type ATPase [Microbacterium aurantiacum]|uniref:Heavy metal translocating P-type ATPase n=1 Tax=Microbacterium aurantiacum TaxID=162393 RepID=A0ABT8FVQ8_9MICO|nr:heavy metal translocating P-type ATPase [Microbacterium aurantiacum]MDN4465261.1 heavy metal translocating P-type ATPase [Microbacterium aurantiacum]
MPRFLRPLTRYPIITATVVVGILALVLALADLTDAARWVSVLSVSGFIVFTLVGMIRDVLRGHVGLDILAVVAMVATLAVGEYAASLIIVLMLSGGQALEDIAGRRANRELTALLERAPRTAHRVRTGPDGTDAVADVPADEVAVGDVLLIRPAEIVPVDGVLLSPAANMDESSLTGESMPVPRTAGEEVLSGSVNGSAAIRVRALRRSADSQYQQIVALVREAQESRAPVVRLADRFAIPFTAVSLVIAGAAWGISGDPTRFAEVLVLATPCPLLIAAPVAFLGGLSRAARAGVIIKGGAVIEQLARVRTAAFDKTGTLTRGHPTVVEVRAADGWTPDDVLRLAASAEQYSTHVLADGIRRAAEERGLPLSAATAAEETATNGVRAAIEGRSVVVGKPRYVRSLAPDTRTVEIASGQAAAYVAVDGVFAGALILADDPRAESAGVIAWLRAHGVERAVMLTGDAEPTARAIAAAVGIDEVRADLLPADKVQLAAGLQPRPVLMVGDGVNDAPVLAAADVGIAMGAKGATAAGEAASVVILKDSLAGVVDAVAIGRDTLRVALSAIGIGIALSIGLMLVATTGLIPAVAGALVQELVDLATILYALRALTGRDPQQDLSTTPHPRDGAALVGHNGERMPHSRSIRSAEPTRPAERGTR